ncbi:MAG: DUF6261 family protein [Tannerellaceae bacterium]|jgi:hypothetical protein|nr:DUF6261 family protein [Tannerellaceae bacterium]
MKVIKFKLSGLRNEEWFRFLTEFRDLIIHFTADAIGLNKLYAEFIILFLKADKLLLVLRKSAYTHELELADQKRDDLFRGFYEVVKGSLKQPGEAKQKAAERLFVLLGGYRTAVLSESYAAESAALYNLLEDLGGTYEADVTTLGVTDWVTAISQAEQAFLSVSEARADESFAKPKNDLKLVRSQLDVFYTAMTGVLDAQLLADGLGGNIAVDPEELDDELHLDDDPPPPHEFHGNIPYNFVVAWNEHVKKYRNLVSQRAGRRHKTDAPDA